MIETVLLIVLVCVALALIGLVLIQQGKGADAGASFGGGASQTVFGSAGSGNFLTKASWSLAGIFFVVCVALAYIARDKASGGEFTFEAPQETVEQVVETDVPQYQEEAAEETDVPAVAEEQAAPEVEAAAIPAEAPAATGEETPPTE